MAEQQDDKSRLPLTGIFALLAMLSSFLIYEGISLKTARPVDREKTNNVFLEKDLVQARLWQDPFEAVETHRLQEGKGQTEPESKDDPHTLLELIKGIRQSGVASTLRVLPVFVDGSPYVNGGESRLNDRYAVISALGAAGYVPESGEHIRFFRWKPEKGKKPAAQKKEKKAALSPQTDGSSIVIPVELFIPKAKIRDEPYGKYVLVLWLKDQDSGPAPLAFLNNLLAVLDHTLRNSKPQITSTFSVLGPRSSTTLSAVVKELQQVPRDASIPPFNILKDVKFYSPWATAEDTFLLDYSPESPDDHKKRKRKINELLENAKIKLTRTITTDAMLAEQLIQELKRRGVDLKSCSDKDCNPKVALISEWDTLYGRALPRTFTAVAMNKGSGKTGPALESSINELRRDEWPKWVYRHSYLGGLDGELPAKSSDKEKDGTPTKSKESQPQGVEPDTGQRPEGRAQLDYVLRLAAALKQEETRNGEEFKAIGVLGSDVYDKLLIFQALRHTFPRAIFFTTDLNARLAYPAQWQSTRNLIVASHFGLELKSELQTPIPAFRDSYQTSLFYSALWAVEHFVSSKQGGCPDSFQLKKSQESEKPHGNFFHLSIESKTPYITQFSCDVTPRLYEIGRHGAFDISTDARPQSSNYANIHAPRPDLETWFGIHGDLKWVGAAVMTAIILLVGLMLLSSTVADITLKLVSNILFWLGLATAGVAAFNLAELMWELMPNAAENEPLSLTEGISVWPTAAIRLLALIMSLSFLWYSWRKLKDNESVLARDFDLEEKDDKSGDELHSIRPFSPGMFARIIHRCLGLHRWRPQAADRIEAAHLWREYSALAEGKNVVMRGLPQVAVALLVSVLMMKLFGFPATPCRGVGCFAINDGIIILSVTAMMMLIFYVVDATRLCRRWVNCIALKKIQWSAGTLTKIATERGRGIGTGKENLDEWLGIELIAERTTVIGNFIYFPFIIMFLLGIARHTYLDNWDFPTALIIIFTLNATLILINAMALRHSAEIARRDAIQRLEKKLMELPDQTPDEKKQRQQIEWAIAAIRNNQRGAFLPFTKHPIFGAAIALPSGGYGLVLLLEYLATSF
ncbi:MAG: hypothetical protein ABIN99_07185 [Nitrosospira sp.]